MDAHGQVLDLGRCTRPSLDFGGCTWRGTWFGWTHSAKFLIWVDVLARDLELECLLEPITWYGLMDSAFVIWMDAGPNSLFVWKHGPRFLIWVDAHGHLLIWVDAPGHILDMAELLEPIYWFGWTLRDNFSICVDVRDQKYLIWMDGWSQFYILVDALDQLLDFDCTKEPFFNMDGRTVATLFIWMYARNQLLHLVWCRGQRLDVSGWTGPTSWFGLTPEANFISGWTPISNFFCLVCLT